MFIINMKKNLFALVMSGFIIATLFVFKSIEDKRAFIQNSQPALIVLDKEIEDVDIVEKNLEKLTYQEVEISSIEGITYVKIKCPPNKTSFFQKIIRDLTE